jgi:hypothetical protein
VRATIRGGRSDHRPRSGMGKPDVGGAVGGGRGVTLRVAVDGLPAVWPESAANARTEILALPRR